MRGSNWFPLPFYHLSLVLLIVWCILCTVLTNSSSSADTQEVGSGSASASSTNNSSGSNRESTRTKLDPAHFTDRVDWGTFYDPQSIFCGQFDCYKILALNYENEPTTKEITRNYRALGRHWHPDKNKEKGAKERFVKIVRAYEVLTNKETRDQYDYFRSRPEAYLEKYGTSVIWKYAPKSDTALVIIALLALLSWLSIWIKKTRWRNLADRIIKASVDGLSLKEGGSNESIEFRRLALEKLAERQAEREKLEKDESGGGGATASNGKDKKKKTRGLDKKELKMKEQEELKAIIVELVEAVHDFGGGFAKPTWRDMFIVKLIKAPYSIITACAWWIQYLIRRTKGLEYTDEELEFFTRRAVGDVIWDTVTEEEKADMKTRRLWIFENLQQWKEEEEFRLLSPGEKKQYNRLKRKTSSAKID